MWRAKLYTLLLIGIYQLLHTRIASHAAINETVNVAREIKKPWATKLINGVLRECQRRQMELEEKRAKEEEERRKILVVEM